MTIEDNIRDEKLQYNINIWYYVKFPYSPFGKTFEKQIKTVKNQGRKLVEVLKVLKPAEHQQKPKSIEGTFPKHLENNIIKNESSEIGKWE